MLIIFLYLPRTIASSSQTIASSLLNPRTWQSLCTTSNHVLFGLPLGLELTTSYSIHFFTQSLSSFRNTCPYHRNLFCCSSDVMSTIPSLSLNSLFETLSFNYMPHIHLTILISALWSAISFSFFLLFFSWLCVMWNYATWIKSSCHMRSSSILFLVLVCVYHFMLTVYRICTCLFPTAFCVFYILCFKFLLYGLILYIVQYNSFLLV